MMPPPENVAEVAQGAFMRLREGLGELADWRALHGATLLPDELKPEGEQTLWPNPWRQDVAMVAHLVHSNRQQLLSETARLKWMVRERAVVAQCDGSSGALYWLEWPDLGEAQIDRYASPIEAIDAAMAVNP